MAIQIQTVRKKENVSQWEQRDYCTWFGLKGFNAKLTSLQGRWDYTQKGREGGCIWCSGFQSCWDVYKWSAIARFMRTHNAGRQRKGRGISVVTSPFLLVMDCSPNFSLARLRSSCHSYSIWEKHSWTRRVWGAIRPRKVNELWMTKTSAFDIFKRQKQARSGSKYGSPWTEQRRLKITYWGLECIMIVKYLLSMNERERGGGRQGGREGRGRRGEIQDWTCEKKLTFEASFHCKLFSYPSIESQVELSRWPSIPLCDSSHWREVLPFMVG